MITLTAKIDILSGDNEGLSVDYTNVYRNNIPSSLLDVIGKRKTATNPFLLGVSKLGDGSTFSDGVDYFISSDLCDENGEFEETLISEGRRIDIKSEEYIRSITIAFDTYNNRHPKTLLINGNEYIDDDAIFTYLFDNYSTKNIRIDIPNWNTPNAPIVITGIYVEVSIDIDQRNLISLERTIYDRADLKLPSFGIISNTGNIEFNDTNGEVLDYAEQLLLQSGLKCEIKLNNTLVNGASQTVAVMETDQWNYDNDSKVVSVSLKDDLEEWQEINVGAINYDPRNLEHKPFSWLYEHLWKLTSNRSSYVNENGETITANGNYNMLSIVELDEDTQAVLNNTYTKYPLLESGSLWEQWTKLCEVCQLHIFKNSYGVVVCRYNGGN